MLLTYPRRAAKSTLITPPWDLLLYLYYIIKF